MPLFRTPRTDRRRTSERGASLIEYGLVTSLFLVGALGVLNQLTDNSESVLNDSGRDISTPRPLDEDLGDSPIAEKPADYVPPTNSDLLTFVDKQIEVGGRCFSVNGAGLHLGNCNAGNVVTLTGLSEDAIALTLAVGDTGQCVVADGDQVSLGSCSGDAAKWTQEYVSGIEVIYRNVETGECITKDGNGLELDDCSNDPDQVLLVQF